MPMDVTACQTAGMLPVARSAGSVAVKKPSALLVKPVCCVIAATMGTPSRSPTPTILQ